MATSRHLTVTLCADDYAIGAGVSRAIVALADQGRLSATSVMSLAPGWIDDAAPLKALRGRIGVGLHFTLTMFSSLGPMPVLAPAGAFPPLAHLVRSALAGRLPLDEIAAEFERQLCRFTDVWGDEPDFVDGHQHVHALPGIRHVVLSALHRHGLSRRLWVRDPSDHPLAILRRGVSVPKAALIAALAAGFGAEIRRAGFAANVGFSGFSPFDPARDYGGDVARFLIAPGRRHMVMCHPGYIEAGDRLDGVVKTRERERAYLASERFAALLEERRITLAASPR